MLVTLVVAAAASLAILAGLAAMLTLWLKTAAPDEALVRIAPAGRRVSFTSVVVFPILQTLERVSLREHPVVLARTGDAALRTADDHAVELVATFLVRVGRSEDDVLRAAQSMGARTGDPDAVRERFAPRFTAALEAVAREHPARTLDLDRDAFKDAVLERVGADLDGFVLDDLAITGVRVLPVSPYRG